jgi:hypothetical protein
LESNLVVLQPADHLNHDIAIEIPESATLAEAAETVFSLASCQGDWKHPDVTLLVNLLTANGWLTKASKEAEASKKAVHSELVRHAVAESIYQLLNVAAYLQIDIEQELNELYRRKLSSHRLTGEGTMFQIRNMNGT